MYGVCVFGVVCVCVWCVCVCVCLVWCVCVCLVVVCVCACALSYFQFEEVAARDDLMGVEDTARKNILLFQWEEDCEIVNMLFDDVD